MHLPQALILLGLIDKKTDHSQPLRQVRYDFDSKAVVFFILTFSNDNKASVVHKQRACTVNYLNIDRHCF